MMVLRAATGAWPGFRECRLKLALAVVVSCLHVVLPASTFAADALAGRSVYFHRCVSCHLPLTTVDLTQDEMSIYDNSLPADDKEMTSRGPALSGLLNRPAATQPGFAYSPALQAANLLWTPENLRQFLTGPAAFLPGNTMHFNGLRRPGELDDLMAYLEGTP